MKSFRFHANIGNNPSSSSHFDKDDNFQYIYNFEFLSKCLQQQKKNSLCVWLYTTPRFLRHGVYFTIWPIFFSILQKCKKKKTESNNNMDNIIVINNKKTQARGKRQQIHNSYTHIKVYRAKRSERIHIDQAYNTNKTEINHIC